MAGFADADLVAVIDAARAEQVRRAVTAGDPAAVAVDAFRSGFDRRRVADPELVAGFVVCRGILVGRGTGHECSFAVVAAGGDEAWCWDHPLVVADEVRRDTSGVQTVTVVAAVDGLIVTQVRSVARGGAHTRKGQRSWQVHDAELRPTAAPASPLPARHR